MTSRKQLADETRSVTRWAAEALMAPSGADTSPTPRAFLDTHDRVELDIDAERQAMWGDRTARHD